MEKYGLIVQNDFLKVIKGIKNANEKTNKKDIYFNRRSEFALLTRQGLNMGQIAKKFGITRQAVSLALQKAVKEGQIVHKTRKGIDDSPNYKIISRKKINQIQCCECGNTFTTEKKRKTCSKKCMLSFKQKKYGGEWSRMIFLDLTCSGCGKSFKRSRYLQKINDCKKTSGSKYYCSRECYCLSRATLCTKKQI